MTKPVLVTIPPSHYCEKARWALDLAGLDYREEGHAPLVHWLFVWPRSRTRTVPMLMLDGRDPLTDSTDIMRYASELLPEHACLYPAAMRDDIEALEDRFDDKLGPATRRLVYCFIAKNPALFKPFIAALPRVERAIIGRGEGVMRNLLGRAFNVSDRARDRMRLAVLAEFAVAEERLASGARYLAGSRFTAADLTFAALAAPVVVPDQSIEQLRALDPAFAELVAGFRKTAAGQFVLRVTKDHRPRV